MGNLWAWVNRHPKISVTALVLILGYLAVAQGASRDSTAAAVETKPAAQAKDIAPLVAGSAAENKDYKLTIVEWVDPFMSSNQFSKPKDGNRWIAAKVLIETTSSGKVGAAGSYFKIKDTAGYQYDNGFGVLGDDKPTLNYISLDPNAKTDGWVLFEVKADSVLSEVRYEPVFGKAVTFRP